MEIITEIKLSEFIKNPVLMQDMAGMMFLFTKGSRFYPYSGYLTKYYHNSETQITKLEFKPPKGIQFQQTDCKGGKATITRNKNLRLLFENCNAIYYTKGAQRFCILVNCEL